MAYPQDLRERVIAAERAKQPWLAQVAAIMAVRTTKQSNLFLTVSHLRIEYTW
jgi:hypothetical protein